MKRVHLRARKPARGRWIWGFHLPDQYSYGALQLGRVVVDFGLKEGRR